MSGRPDPLPDLSLMKVLESRHSGLVVGVVFGRSHEIMQEVFLTLNDLSIDFSQEFFLALF